MTGSAPRARKFWIALAALMVMAGCALSPSDQRTQAAPQQEFDDCGGADWCPRMVTIPGGNFIMGAPVSEAGSHDLERPQHPVAIRRFAAGKYDVTRGQWAAFVSATRRPDPEVTGNTNCTWREPGFEQMDDEPVVCVSWDDAQDYVRWLSQRTGQIYRLLSEAEWEYAARAGTTSAFYTGESIATTQGNFGAVRNRTQKVGSYPANAYGLYDMAGNVWQWVEDCWNLSYDGAPATGYPAWSQSGCTQHVMRGGSWYFGAPALRSANRVSSDPTYRSVSVGFRVARMMDSRGR
jgi:formylglycine-generating enzyme required for sulfatase activity